jgi:hypothetical protein
MSNNGFIDFIVASRTGDLIITDGMTAQGMIYLSQMPN